MLNSVSTTKIFLIGMMGAGKTSVGLTLSRIIGIPFTDIDELIDTNSYFKNHSIDEFRIEEKKQIRKVMLIDENRIISVGGGAILNQDNRQIINRCTCIFLKTSIDNLINRIQSQNITRPLIKFSDNGDIDKFFFTQIYKERKQHYLDVSDFVIDTDNENILNVAMKINGLLLDNEIIN